jgi:hypothetical protein
MFMTLASITRASLRLLLAAMLVMVSHAADDKKPAKPASPAPAPPVVPVAPAETKKEAAPAPALPNEEPPREEEDEEILAEKKDAEDTVKAARPVTSDLVQVYGWREKVKVGDMADLMVAKLDTGATTSSLHAENQQIFEREGKKWVKFVVKDPGQADAKRYDMEAPLVRTVLIKEPGGESERRNVVRLTFTIGERNIKAEFTLNNRNNMVCPVLIGRTTIQVLGWVDPSRTYLADDKILR